MKSKHKDEKRPKYRDSVQEGKSSVTDDYLSGIYWKRIGRNDLLVKRVEEYYALNAVYSQDFIKIKKLIKILRSVLTAVRSEKIEKILEKYCCS